MTEPNPLAPRMTMVVTTVALLPLLWWCLTLAAGALGIWWEVTGDVVVTWNIDTAVGLILLIPAAVLVFKGVFYLEHSATFRRGRWYATAGLSLTSLFCLLEVLSAVSNVFSPPAFRDPYSWSPVLSAGEEWVVAAPSAVFLVSAYLTIISLWRHQPASYIAS